MVAVPWAIVTKEVDMFIWGFRTNSRIVGRLKADCIFCGDTCIQTIGEMTRVFTLFFIPLFAISKKIETTCTSCGYSSKPFAVSAKTPTLQNESPPSGGVASPLANAAKLELPESESESTEAFPGVRKDLLVRQSLAVIAVVSSFLLILGLTNSGFRESFFGTPGVVTKTVPVYVTPKTFVDWEVGACLAQSPSGGAYPVKCNSSHYAVITAKVTSAHYCPYVADYASSYTAENLTFATDSMVWCAVRVDVSHP
jgi:hypothetical protein